MAPQVTSMTPGEVTQAGTEQTVTVYGSNFLAGITATLLTPEGAPSLVDVSAISDVRPGSLALRFRFARAGGHRLQLTNPSSPASEPFSFAVAAVPEPVERVPGSCVSPAPLQGFLDPQAPGYIVTFHAGTDVDATLRALQARYSFSPTYVYRSALLGFSALLRPNTVEALRCETVVKYVAYNGSTSIGR